MSFHTSPPSKVLPPEYRVEKLTREQILEKLRFVKSITMKNLLEGTGEIEKIDGIFDDREKNHQETGYILTFGKYKGQAIASVKDDDPSYFNWMMENNNFFAQKAREEGLT